MSDPSSENTPAAPYTFVYLQTCTGSTRRCATGTVRVRVTDAIETPVHIDVLYDASGLYRGLVDNGLDPEACFDVRASGLAPWHVDSFLSLAYGTEWTWPDDVTRLEVLTQTCGFFDAAEHIYCAADQPAVLVSHLLADPAPSNVLDALLAVDPVRALMPRTFLACMRATQAIILDCDGRPRWLPPSFDVMCARREDMKRLSHDTLVDLLGLHRPLRDNSVHFLADNDDGYHVWSDAAVVLSREQAMARRCALSKRAVDSVVLTAEDWVLTNPTCHTVDVPKCDFMGIVKTVTTRMEDHHCPCHFIWLIPDGVDDGGLKLVLAPTTGRPRSEHPLRHDVFLRGTFEATIDGTVYECHVPHWTHTVSFSGWPRMNVPRVNFEGSIRIMHH